MNTTDQNLQRNPNIESTVIQWIVNEVKHLFVGIWNVLRRFIIIIVAISIVLKIVALVMLPTVCQFPIARLVIGRYCPLDKAYNDNSATNKFVPIGLLFEKSISLTEILTNSDVSAPSRMIESQLGITEIIITLRHSKIDSLAKDDLLTHFTTLKQSTQKAADELSGLVAVYDTVVDYLHTYAENALIRLTQGVTSSHSLTDDRQNSTERSFNDSISLIQKKLEQLLEKAQNAHCHLQGIDEQLIIIRDLLEKNKMDIQDQLDQLESGTVLAKLYRLTLGNRQHNQIKFQQNSNTLNGLIDFVRSSMANMKNVIIKFKTFKNNAVKVEETVSEITLQSIFIDTHIELLKKAINHLDTSKEVFHGKRRLNDGHES